MKLSWIGSFFLVITSLFLAFQNCAQAPQNTDPIKQDNSTLTLKATATAFNPHSQWQLLSIEKIKLTQPVANPDYSLKDHQINLQLSELLEPEINCLGDCGQRYQLTVTSSCLSAEGLLTNRWIEWEQSEVTQIQLQTKQEDSNCHHLNEHNNILKILVNVDSLKVMSSTDNEFLYLFAEDHILTFKKHLNP